MIAQCNSSRTLAAGPMKQDCEMEKITQAQYDDYMARGLIRVMSPSDDETAVVRVLEVSIDDRKFDVEKIASLSKTDHFVALLTKDGFYYAANLAQHRFWILGTRVEVVS